MKKDLLSINDLTIDDIQLIFKRANFIRKKYKSGQVYHPLKGKTLGMLFNKSSTRTRISFEAGMYHLGGKALFLNAQDIQIDRGETVADSARVFSQYLDSILVRTYKHKDVEDFAEFASIPVINGLTETYHPCQILSDMFTIQDKLGNLKGVKVVYVGDCNNNIANSWIIGASKIGMDLTLASPEDYRPQKSIMDLSTQYSASSGSRIALETDPHKAVIGADVVYTDVWTSMGQEKEYKHRLNVFKGYRVDFDLVRKAKTDTLIMHCLPAHRGEEITSEVMDSEQSIVFEEAGNRLFVQNAILDILVS